MMIHKIIFKRPFLRLTFKISSQISTRKDFEEKFAKKDYFAILGIGDKDRKPDLRGKDLHRIYLSQIKKYHSDQVENKQEKAELDEIVKIISQAYDQIKKKDFPQFDSPSSSPEYTDEDEVAEKMFGKRYLDIKHTLYASGNQHLRLKFIAELQKLKQQRHGTKQQQSSPFKQQRSAYYGSQSSTSSGGMGTGLAVLACLAMLPFLQSKPKNPAKQAIKANPDEQEEDVLQKQHTVKEYTEEELDIIHLNTKKIAIKPFERFLNNLMRRRPHILRYPSGEDPSVIDQLTTYSIGPDIHLYEVSPSYFLSYEKNRQLLQANSDQGVEKYELKETKPNTALTLSLEAERMLHNIYVNVDDVLAEIKEKGKFTPPKVFFKFFGYIMFEIRDKPFSTLQNYRNTKYISLFDLYFDYYSPIFFKRNYFCDYLVGLDKEEPLKNTRYFGNVHLNHRTIPCRYLEKGQKVVVMREVRSAYNQSGKHLRDWEQKYKDAWENYYARFEKNWKQYCMHQTQEG